MLLQPKRRKFKKAQKGRLNTHLSAHAAQRGNAAQTFTLKYGDAGLITMAAARFHSRQIEAGRRTITGSLKRAGRLWIRAFPDRPVSEKPNEAGMGKGKGPVSFWVAPIKPGQILYELSGVSDEMASKALLAASKKLPFPTKIVFRAKLPLLHIEIKFKI